MGNCICGSSQSGGARSSAHINAARELKDRRTRAQQFRAEAEAEARAARLRKLEASHKRLLDHPELKAGFVREMFAQTPGLLESEVLRYKLLLYNDWRKANGLSDTPPQQPSVEAALATVAAKCYAAACFREAPPEGGHPAPDKPRAGGDSGPRGPSRRRIYRHGLPGNP